MNNSSKRTIAYYKDAILKLRRYIAVETDEESCEEAAAKIREYRFKIIDESFDDIVHRTKRLNTLMYDLKAIIANASNTQTISRITKDLQNIVTDMSNSLNVNE